MIGSYPSEVVRTVGALLSPFVLLFGLFVVAHGHYGPGGGFAGGVVMAVSPMLLRLTFDERFTQRWFPSARVLLIALLGFLVFVLIGLAPVVAGGAFLDYAAVPIGEVAASRLRYLGILAVEVAIGFAVFGTVLAIFDVVTGSDTDG